MPRLSHGKKGLYIIIDEELDRKLRELIVLKHGRFAKGLLSREVEEALWYWVRLHTHKHTNPIVGGRINPHPKVHQVFEQIKDYFRKKYKYLPQQVTLSDLEEAISAIRGSDRRTIRKWLDLFIRWKLVKPIAPQVYEIV